MAEKNSSNNTSEVINLKSYYLENNATEMSKDEIATYTSYDNIPHIRDLVDNADGNKIISDVGVTYANHNEGGSSDVLHRFQKYRTSYEAGKEYTYKGFYRIFITKPNLNIKYNPNDSKDFLNYNSTENGFMEFITRNYPAIVQSLTYNNQSAVSPVPKFIPLLYNNYKSMNVEDHTFLEMTYGETYRGFSQKLPTTYGQSQAGGTVQVTYTETSPPLVLYLHKLWFEYVEKVKFGFMSPTIETIKCKELDYASSLYVFSFMPDGYTIDFWGRYTGIIPQSVPYSAFFGGMGDSGIVETNCTYLYSDKRFMEPELLLEFNDIFCSGSNHNSIINTNKSGDLADEVFNESVNGLIRNTGSINNPSGINLNQTMIPNSKYLSRNSFSGAGIFSYLDSDGNLRFAMQMID